VVGRVARGRRLNTARRHGPQSTEKGEGAETGGESFRPGEGRGKNSKDPGKKKNSNPRTRREETRLAAGAATGPTRKSGQKKQAENKDFEKTGGKHEGYVKSRSQRQTDVRLATKTKPAA